MVLRWRDERTIRDCRRYSGDIFIGLVYGEFAMIKWLLMSVVLGFTILVAHDVYYWNDNGPLVYTDLNGKEWPVGSTK